MPSSWDGTRCWLEPWIEPHLGPNKVVLDAGCGYGALGYLVRMLDAPARPTHLVGVEAWSEAVRVANDAGWYDRLILGDLREWLASWERAGERFDCILFGDVLEHLTPEDAETALARARRISACVIATCPLGPGWEQGAVGGNECERHLWQPLPGWFFARGARRAVILSAETRGRYGLDPRLDIIVAGGGIPLAIGSFLFPGSSE